MNSAKAPISQHRKKKYVFKEREAPFPVPIASITRETPSENYWYHYTGQIQGGHVIVTHSGDISYLYRMGYFGRGLMSRGAPAVYKDLPYVHLPSAGLEEPDVVHVMRRRMYLKHMKWRKAHDIRLSSKEGEDDSNRQSVAPEDEEYNSDVEYFHPDYVHGDDMKSDTPHLKTTSVRENIPGTSSAVNDTDISGQQNNNLALNADSANQKSSLWSWNEELSNQKTSNDFWDNSTANEKGATDAWDKMEADEDFWASGDMPDDKDKSKENSKPVEGETVFNNADYCNVPNVAKKRDQDDIDGPLEVPVKKVKLSNEINDADDSEKINQSSCQSLPQGYALTDDGSKSECPSNQNYSVTNDTKVSESKVLEGESKDVVERIKVDEQNIERTIIEENDGHVERNNEKGASDNSENAEKNSESHIDKTNLTESLPIHPYCRQDDDDDKDDETAVAGDEFLVIDDSDIDDSTEIVHRKEKYTWTPIRKKEIFNFNEPLVLSFEEAYFLCYGLGCFTVQDEKETSLTLTDLWCRFCNKQQFLPRYVAYHYFRSKGWVPKPSLLFGTDFIVYKVGPEFYHASYSVIVKTVYEGTFEEVEGYNSRKLNWTSIFGLNRVTEHVAKTLVYCYVIMPRDLSDEERKSPECIARFKVRLQTVQRWVSSQERDKDKVADDIT
ncbi:tRNA-splicing endonuclease subunit Sen2-like [Mercenaria mercenaria]|uniref:tRNA-splicing endonuclease subunit Sen2-like n=1 Tax=Mercenaria mercenaria TaxID=6596 RepID=UPI00234E4967|nr:tRNA-splicing endonuclease subunit Sen2-like [Mercenaria mercenaria]